MSNYEDDIEPIADPSDGPVKRARLDHAHEASTSVLDADLRAARLSPEPDEDLDLSQGRHPVWLVKVPKFLLQAWSSIQTDDLRLGTVRVYDPDHTGHQRMELLLPEPPQPPIPTEPGKARDPRWETVPRAYDLKLTTDSAATLKRNIFAFKEKMEEVDKSGFGSSSSLLKRSDDLDAGNDGEDDDVADDAESDDDGRSRKKGKRKRSTALIGMVTNEAALQPQIRSAPADTKATSTGIGSSAPISDSYRELLRKRREEASKPKRTIKMLDSTDAGRHNMLVAGVGGGLSSLSQKSHFNAAISAKPRARSSTHGAANEKFARIPKNELLDLLFTLFERWQYWSLKKLREETQQPESYLRETLTGIADLHKRGPYVGNWSLKPEYSDMRKEQEKKDQERQQAQQQQATPLSSTGNGHAQDDEDEDFGENDDDSDDDVDGDDFEDV